MSESKRSIRIHYPVFTRQLNKLKRAADAYFQTPVHVVLPITLMDIHDSDFEHINDEIKIAIINVNHKSADPSIVVIHAQVVDGSKEFKKVPVSSEGNADAEEEVLHNGDFITIVADTANGDAVITLCADNNERATHFDNLSSILPRLNLTDCLPESKGTPIAWDDFDPDQENN